METFADVHKDQLIFLENPDPRVPEERGRPCKHPPLRVAWAMARVAF
jgi:hypothetical protein